MKALRVSGAVFLLLGLGLALSWPVLNADSDYELTPRSSSAPISAHSHWAPANVGVDSEAEIATGVLNGRHWTLLVGSGERYWCWSFVIALVTERPGVTCFPPPPEENGAQTLFIPSELSHGLQRAVLVAALPPSVHRLQLRATLGAIRAQLVRAPGALGPEMVMLVAFLEPRTDIVDAAAWDEAGDPVQVGALEDKMRDF
jgi:hypothetical protein